MKLQILIPQYKETEEVIKPLLDSIAIQQNVDMYDIGVIIVNDGSNVRLSDTFLNSYPFLIEYYLAEHKGVSATRNRCLDEATAEYVMFCDADDMFYNACGLYIVFREIYNGGFDTLVSSFIEESREPKSRSVIYINHNMDSTFVHGKIHRREWLINQGIRWDDSLTIHEDSYFNVLCQKLAKPERAKYCPTPFYLWKWRDDSVCRHDPKYILKTYNNLLDSNTALVKQFIQRKLIHIAQELVCFMVFDAYFTLNKDEWINQENQEYRKAVERRFKKYFTEFKLIFDSVQTDTKNQIIIGLKNRMYQEGLFMEHITFDDWVLKIQNDDGI